MFQRVVNCVICLISVSLLAVPNLAFSQDEKPASKDKSAYNATWPKGRGFGIGQTVPDIPLIDMKGKEVRLSKFLGKQYVLYCWASW